MKSLKNIFHKKLGKSNTSKNSLENVIQNESKKHKSYANVIKKTGIYAAIGSLLSPVMSYAYNLPTLSATKLKEIAPSSVYDQVHQIMAQGGFAYINQGLFKPYSYYINQMHSYQLNNKIVDILDKINIPGSAVIGASLLGLAAYGLAKKYSKKKE